MTPSCEKVLDWLGQGPLPADLEAHARSCPFCQARLAVLETLPLPAVPAPDAGAATALRETVLKELSAQPRAKPWWYEPLVVSGLSLAAVVVSVLVLGRQGLVHNQVAWPGLLLTGVLLLGVIVWGTVGAFAPGSRWIRSGLIAFALEAAAVVALGGSGVEGPASFVRQGVACALTEVGASALPLGITVWMLARIAYQPQRVFAAGLAAGAVGMLALHLHCACGTFAHLAVFHVVPWMALAALSLLLRSLLPSRTFAP